MPYPLQIVQIIRNNEAYSDSFEMIVTLVPSVHQNWNTKVIVGVDEFWAERTTAVISSQPIHDEQWAMSNELHEAQMEKRTRVGQTVKNAFDFTKTQHDRIYVSRELMDFNLIDTL